MVSRLGDRQLNKLTSQTNGTHEKSLPGSPEPKIDEDTARRVGQMMLVSFDGFTVTSEIKTMIEKFYVGNIILSRRNIKDACQLANLTRELQGIAEAAGFEVPLLIGIDQENGMVSRFGDGIRATHFPGAMAIAATRLPNQAFEVAKATAKELAAVGINWIFAPVLDVVNEATGSAISVRSFGDDPQNVGRFGVAFAEGLRAGGIASCAKHFPGANATTSTDGRRRSIFTIKTRDELESTEFVPFRRAVAAGLDSVRISTSIWSDDSQDESPKHIVEGILRRQIGYEGVVICECTDMPCFLNDSNIATAILNGVKSGCDMLMVSHTIKTQIKGIEALYSAIHKEEMLISRIYQSSSRISTLKRHYLRWKIALQPNFELLPSLMNDHQILSKRVYDSSITVVRDEKRILPLSAKLTMRDTLLLLTPIVRPLHPNIPGELPVDPFECFGRALNRRHPKIRHAPYSVHGLSSIHVALIKSSAAVIFVTANAIGALRDYQIQTARAVERFCTSKPLITLAACDPYDLLSEGSFGTYMCTYEYTSTALESAAAVIFGQQHAPGVIPVGIPGIPARRQQKQWYVEVWEKRRDLYASADLWKECLGQKWQLDATTLSTLLDRPGYSKHFIVRNPSNSELLGLCCTFVIMQNSSQIIGSLALLIVRPSYRNLGIGLSLHDVAVRHLNSIPGITSMQLGSIFPRIFPGLPLDLPLDDAAWFSHRGWKFEEKYVYDLFMRIDNWTVPEHIMQSIQAKGVTFHSCTPDAYEALMEFERKNFDKYPGWVQKYENLRDTNDLEDAVIATAGEGIVGAVLVYSPVSNNQMSKDIPWPKMIGERNGGLACVSVGREFRGQGLGLALICSAILELKSRGLTGCFVDWVDYSEFETTYEQLGFQQWAKYREIWRNI